MADYKKLTPEQTARFPEYVERWTKIGLCTDPADRHAAEEAIRLMYKSEGLDPPKEIVWSQSPYEQAIKSAKRLGKTKQEINSYRQNLVWNSCYGSHDAPWLAFYAFFREVMGLEKETAKLEGLWLLAKSGGWVTPYKEICFISERHNILERNDRGQLHSLIGPACAYPDGWGVYAVHGVRVPKYVIMEREKITVELIEKESNAEVRRVMIDQFGGTGNQPPAESTGPALYLKASGAKVIDYDERYGTLLRKEVSGDEAILMVELVNSTAEPDGTFKKYHIRVDPECRPLFADGTKGKPQKLTARAAVASTFGMTAKEYAPEFES